MTKRQDLYCCGCKAIAWSRLTDGSEIYPHRTDLAGLPFWKCDECGNYVGCHHKTRQRTKPLGVIPTAEIRKARAHIHEILDPLWKSGTFERGRLYHEIASALGIQKFHTADLRSIEDCRAAYKAVQEVGKAG